MPNRLSKLLSPNTEKEALAAEERKQSSDSSSPPPSYQQHAPPYDQDDVLSPPDIAAGFRDLNINSNTTTPGFPQPEECIAHLKVLECFYRLRQTIGSRDGVYGIYDSMVSDSSHGLLAKLAEKRWACYVQKAVDRFEVWWKAITPNARAPDRVQFEKDGRQGHLVNPRFAEGQRIVLDKSNLPPPDVLMVWHSYMLSPRAYLEDCLRYGRMPLWHTPFPWQAVSDSINAESFTYEADSATQTAFTSLTGLPWDSLQEKSVHMFRCPSCKSHVQVALTKCAQRVPVSGPIDDEETIDRKLSYGSGFCDRDFLTSCKKCALLIDHDQLRSSKLCTDIKRLIQSDQPLGGTVLGDAGLPYIAFGKRDERTTTSMALPNDLFRTGLGNTILRNHASLPVRSVADIRNAIEDSIRDSAYMRKVRGSHAHRLQRADRIAIRKMMSRYWSNSSPFALDLVGAVIRQGSFIEKMHNIDWLHSPALPNTMSRLITKYSCFQEIMAKFSEHMAVPTLDVDLAWHTHQLSPYNYMEYTVRKTGQFIDHDDKVAETKLNDAFAWTSKTYQKMTGQPYSECTCWYCEAVRESHTSAASRLFSTDMAKATDMLHVAEQDPSKSVHISAHNAVRPTDSSRYDLQSQRKAVELEKQYEKACERARKKGRPVPKRDDYYYSDAYGYPVYIPAYSPYVGFVPYAPMYYPATPGCMAVGLGAVGNCCSGTCGGGVAAGGKSIPMIPTFEKTRANTSQPVAEQEDAQGEQRVGVEAAGEASEAVAAAAAAAEEDAEAEGAEDAETSDP